MKGSLGTVQIVSYNIHCFSDNFLYTTNKNTTQRLVDYMFLLSLFTACSVYIYNSSYLYRLFLGFPHFIVFFVFHVLLTLLFYLGFVDSLLFLKGK